MLFFSALTPYNLYLVIRVVLFVFGILIFVRLVKFRERVKLLIIRELENEYGLYSKQGNEMKYWIRLNRIQTALFLKFNKEEFPISRKKLIILGEDILNIYVNDVYQMKFPTTLITVLLSIEAMVLVFFDPSKLSLDVKTQIIAGNGVLLL